MDESTLQQVRFPYEDTIGEDPLQGGDVIDYANIIDEELEAPDPRRAFRAAIDPIASPIVQALIAGADFTPVLGDAISAVDAYNLFGEAIGDIGEGEYWSAAGNAGLGGLAALGAVPLLGSIADAAKQTKRFDAVKDWGALTKRQLANLIEKAIPGAASRPAFAALANVDEADAPMQFLHGTSTPIKRFSTKALGATTNASSAKEGIFASNLAADADAYAEYGAGLSGMVENRVMARNKSKLEELWEQSVEAPRKQFKLDMLTNDTKRKELRRYYDSVGHDWAIKQLDAIDHIVSEAPVSPETWPLPTLSYAHSTLVDDALRNIMAFATPPELDRAYAPYYHALKRQARWLDRAATLPKAQPNVVPLNVHTDNPYIVDMAGGGFGSITRNIRAAKDAGHDATIFFDIKDPSNHAIHFVGFEPNQLRLPWAAFDPAKKDSSDLLASVGGAALISALLGDDEGL